jgi:transcriptional regulator GlxA family with amidase domain
MFCVEVGETPARYVERVRVEAARTQLEHSDASLDVVARDCGFGTAESLRRAFQRRLGVAPDSYRRRFRSTNIHQLHAVS